MIPTTVRTDPLAAQLATIMSDLRLHDVPEPVRATAKLHILDALGVGLAATGMDFGHAIHLAGQRLGHGESARALGFGTPLPTSSAALVNGTLLHGLDFDDTHIGAIYHATAPALAAALAVAEEQHASGEQLLFAYIVALEVGCRLAAAGAGQFHGRGFHPTGIAGAFAAVCATAILRDLEAPTLTSALGLCGSQAAGILELHESWLKRMHPGWAAHAGIAAATMAEAGFRGPATVFEGPGGLYNSHLGKTVTAEDLGLQDLGDRWMTTGIALKPYPCCHFTHAFADAAIAILADLGRSHLTADEVASIECPTTPALIPMVTEPATNKMAPTTIYDALFSVQYVVATALSGRRVDLAAFYDQPLDDPAVLALAAKVTCTADPDSDFPVHFPGEVVVHLRDGRSVRSRISASLGTPENPLSDNAIHAKFQTNAARVVGDEQLHQLAALVGTLEHLPAINGLLDGCVIAHPSPDATSS